ncbi:16S rRNA (uracil(1498)-N(3))-methyltransferase [Sediminibacillus massiliensis]|uniref:16S rRNA (uracil(1498)-N(3))-methyltransferase n=1 Tax=Sediminibacillus massiliensis TaxID=1926277 RepID=UPI00098868CC|nr:16S rRNA (uracil(1498)-N(3))-methyltransferase [Sediminibacillus massiliensis]
MQRYFVSDYDPENATVTITGDDVHHISRVMRMEAGDSIICMVPEGHGAMCRIAEVKEDLVVAEIIEWLEEAKDLPVMITIAQGLPKGDKMELVLQKGTELGAFAFLPFQADRSIVKWDYKKAEKKLSRYGKIVKEASEQSHRTSIPRIHQVVNLVELLELSKQYDHKIFAYEDEAKSDTFQRFGDVLNEVTIGQSVLVCFGPEGGFSEREVEMLRENGFLSVRLGPRILRAETAPLYLLSAVSYHFEEMR